MTKEEKIEKDKVNYQFRTIIIKKSIKLIKANSKSLFLLLLAELVVGLFYLALFCSSIYIILIKLGEVNSLIFLIGIAMLLITILDLPFALVRNSIFRIVYLKIISSPDKITIYNAFVYAGERLPGYIKIRILYYLRVLLFLPLIKKPVESAYYYSLAEYFYILENISYEVAFTKSKEFMASNWVPSLKMIPYRVLVLAIPISLVFIFSWVNLDINFAFFFPIFLVLLMELVFRIFYLSLNFVIFKKSKNIISESKMTFSF